MKLICGYCGKEYEPPLRPNGKPWPRRLYCSDQCKWDLNNKRRAIREREQRRVIKIRKAKAQIAEQIAEEYRLKPHKDWLDRLFPLR